MIFIYIIYLVCAIPFIELGIIICKSRKEKEARYKINELVARVTHLLSTKEITKEQFDFITKPVKSKISSSNDVNKEETINNKAGYNNLSRNVDKIENYQIHINNDKDKNKKAKINQGVAALIIGVLFIFLAGIIFATTTWRILPGIIKAMIVLLITCIFFGVSILADKKFNIKSTSKAFYILGSAFVFISIISFGYFGLLGKSMRIGGNNENILFFLGVFLSEVSLIIGKEKLKDSLAYYIIFFGITVNYLLLINCFNLSNEGYLLLLSIFAISILLGNKVLTGVSQYKKYSLVNLYLISIIISIIPMKDMGHCYSLIIATSLICINNIINLIYARISIIHDVASIIMMVVSLLYSTFISLICYKVTLSTVLSVALILIYLSVIAKVKESEGIYILQNMAYLVFINVFSLYFQLDLEWNLIIAIFLFEFGFVFNFHFKSKFETEIKKLLCGINLLALMVFLLIVSYNNELIIQMILFLEGCVFAYIVYRLSRINFPNILLLNSIILWIIIQNNIYSDIKCSYCIFIYYVVLLLWDLIFKKDYCIPIVGLGMIIPIINYIFNFSFLPYSFFVIAYLFIKKNKFDKISLFNLLIGSFLCTEVLLNNFHYSIITPAVIVVIGYIIATVTKKEKKDSNNYLLISNIFSLILLYEFYNCYFLKLNYLIFCIGYFVFIYLLSLREKKYIYSFISSIMVIPLPFNIQERFDLGLNQINIILTIVILTLIILMKLLSPIIKKLENKIIFIDWINVFSIIWIMKIIGTYNEKWQCMGVILLSIYVFQYVIVENKNLKAIVIIISEMLICMAIWIQPFIAIPEIISLEVVLIPIAIFTYLLDRIVKGVEVVNKIQTIIYVFLLTVLSINAISSNNQMEALIIGILLFFIFIGAFVLQSSQWMRISGGLLLILGLYVTRSFWLSISWWIYLLVVGMILIFFAAKYETGGK